MDAGARWLVWSTSLQLRRAARERRRRLAREIGEYRTTAERDDLLAAVERCTSPGREEIRRLVVATAVCVEMERTPFHLRP
jgi:hypothetical protein